MAQSMAADRRGITTAVAASILGLVVHNVVEFPVAILVRPETLVPAAITLLLGVGMLRLPRALVFGAAAAWALLVIVGGAASVLPLSIWPFVPEQTAVHYAVHVVYAAAQVPLLLVAYRGARRT